MHILNFNKHTETILSLFTFSNVDCFFIDYGTQSVVHLCHVRFLLKKLGEFPSQAINVKCGGIKPAKKTWPKAALSRFFSMVQLTNCGKENQGVILQIMSKKANAKPEVIVYDTVSNQLQNGIILNDVMIREGFAKKNPKWTRRGLLPWEVPYEQCVQRNFFPENPKPCKKEAETDRSSTIPVEWVKKAITTVVPWLEGVDVNARFDDTEEERQSSLSLD